MWGEGGGGWGAVEGRGEGGQRKKTKKKREKTSNKPFKLWVPSIIIYMWNLCMLTKQWGLHLSTCWVRGM